ncbi:sensor histidine kinase [Lentzea kentuckyensis]|uniref:sensor histidine kinase n=1 Tax=Lentzea kentuckyensis TaxID=360086 RepID=UPI001302CBA9|nr:histidine kinase [Lentzea kentuckyensis]
MPDSLTARLDRWAREHAGRLDVVLAGSGWLLFGLPSALVAGLPGIALATAAILPLAVRRRYPVAVLGWSIAAFVLQLVVLPVPLPANIAQAFAVYTVAAHVTSLTVRVGALIVAVGGCLAGGLRWSTPPAYLANAIGTAAFLAAFTTLIWTVGNLVRGREINRHRLREATVRLERVAAAREIHDIVAHSLTVVIVQTNGAEYTAAHAESWDRADAAAVLATIGRTARSALAEVRVVIDVLRDADPDEHPEVRVAELRQLVDSVQAAGLRVVLDAEPGAFERLPAAVRFALLRVVREALTNVLKHAGENASAHVTFEQTRQKVRVRVTDDGLGHNENAGSAGRGLGGMRERVRAVGGELSSGPLPGGGFAVDAEIPLPGGNR